MAVVCGLPLKAPNVIIVFIIVIIFVITFDIVVIIVIIGMDDNFDNIAFDSFCPVPFSMTKSPSVTDSLKVDDNCREIKSLPTA